MIKNFTLIALSCFVLSFISSCTKDSADSANPGGTSLYSFDGAPGTCATPVVAGIYAVGRQLDLSNTLTFTVNVTVKGTYSLTTTNSNGVFFAGSGTFTTTGPQTVVLTGQGTPNAAGNFPYVPVTSNTCNFTVSFLSGAPAAVFTYAGGTGTCTAPVISGTYAAGIALGSGNYVDLAVNVTTPGAYTVSTNSSNGMSFSGSGAFSATGAQVLRLIGNGTPAAQGPSFSFTPTGGCSFSITVAPPPPPASFTYTCAAPTISGTFAAGTALTAASTITLGVNVTTAGLYSVTTNTDNGVTFSASGVFPGTGAQTITLRSTNTPTSGGTFSYTASGGGCPFDVTYTTGPPPPADFIKFSVDGGPLLTFAVNPSGFDDNSSAPYNITVDADLTSGGDNFSISVTDENNPVVTAFDYKNRNLLAAPTKYCEIVYTTGAGFPYGSQIANSNTFTVRLTTLSATTVTGSFSGKVYADLGTGTGSKTISNGTFSINF